VVHRSNRERPLHRQLSLIYQGKITNWREVGGNDKKIIVISRDTSSGTMKLGAEGPSPGQVTRGAASGLERAIVQSVSKNPYALGYIGIGYLNPSIKA